MQIAIVAIPSAPQGGGRGAMLGRVVEFGQRVERLGFAGCWIVDAFARGQAMLDPLMFLSTMAGVTERIELGTCVMQVPLRHPVELAHRAQTLHVLSGGRFRFGVGSCSTRHDFDAVQADYERRFKTLTESLSVMRRVWAGEAVHGPALSLWPGTEGVTLEFKPDAGVWWRHGYTYSGHATAAAVALANLAIIEREGLLAT